MVEISTQTIAKAISQCIDKISCEVEESCYRALSKAYEIEDNKTSKFALKVMKDNFDLAKAEHRPVCQDTGMVVVFMQIGQNVVLTGELLQTAVDKEVEKGNILIYFPMLKSICFLLSKHIIINLLLFFYSLFILNFAVFINL